MSATKLKMFTLKLFTSAYGFVHKMGSCCLRSHARDKILGRMTGVNIMPGPEIAQAVVKYK